MNQFGPLFETVDHYTKSRTRAEEMFDKFKEYHLENPDVYRLFDKFTIQAIDSGKENYSCRAIFHRIRWHTEIETRSGDCFKIGNNHSPYYGRLWEAKNPGHDGFFRKRKLTSQDRIALSAEWFYLPAHTNIHAAPDEQWLDSQLKELAKP